jgi:hypothetical protein
MSIVGLDNFVTLRESDHRYFDRNTEEYLSTSKFLKNFYKPFDSNMIAGQVASSEGVPKQVILDRWQAQTDEGTRRHEAIELYLKTTTVLPENEDLRPMVMSIANQYKSYYRIHNEVVLYDIDEKRAGTADLILETTSHKNSPIDIGDFKNYNKGLNQKEVDKNGKCKNEYMLGPLSHLQNSSYNKLCLQLSDYAYKLEKQSGRRIGKLFGHWISPENPLINYQVPCFYLKYEILAMIEWAKENPIIIESHTNKSLIPEDWSLS